MTNDGEKGPKKYAQTGVSQARYNLFRLMWNIRSYERMFCVLFP